MANVCKNHVIYLNLNVWDEDGSLLESSDDGDAFSYVHGQGCILPRLEDALDGLGIGDCIDITTAPLDGYGEYIEDASVNVTRAQLDPGIELLKGTGVSVNGPNGVIELYIIEFDDESVTLDANHPYAGKTLRFEARVLAIRPAHRDEIWHRRVHPGGHHLMVSDSSFAGE